VVAAGLLVSRRRKALQQSGRVVLDR
jgi:hypothetical protein